VNTYVDPATGTGYEYGVQNFIDIGNATAFFHRLGVNTSAPPARSPVTTRYVDFTTGMALANFSPPSSNDSTDALKKTLTIFEQYENITSPGFWNFPLPKDIPADLLLKFGDFVSKYNLSIGVPRIFSTTGFGTHNLLERPTFWLMQAFGIDIARAFTGAAKSFVPASRKNQDLYDAVLKFLGSDVLLSSTVVRSTRSDTGVVLHVQARDGKVTEVHAKRLLVAIVPTAENTAPLDLDKEEKEVFGALNYTRTFVGVVSHPSLPVNTTIVNTPSAAQPANYMDSIPAPPFHVRFDYFGAPSTLYRVMMAGNETLTAAAAKELVSDSLVKMIRAGTLQGNATEALKWLAFEDHGLMSTYTSAEVLKSGFIQRLYAQQGRRSTWYTGAAWSTHLTTSLWQFTETVLPKLKASL
jgi:hypothetical protein